MGEVDEVVDLGAGADDGGVEGASVDTGASAQMHIVAEDDATDVPNADAILEAIAEALVTDDGVGP